VEIRHADPIRDAAACAAIYAPFVSETAVSFEQETPDETEFAARIERISETHPFLVAVDRERVIGFAYASAHRERSAYRWAADVAVYVASDERRGGVGRALYDDLLLLLASQGFRVACAGITLPNAASVGLHEALGFTAVGVYRRIGYKLGAWHDVGWWHLQLAPNGEDPPEIPGRPQRLDGGT
jgi:phosphinothricin acetyltransferase